MLRRSWWVGLALLMLGFNSGCHLFCDRYCEREWDRDHYNHRGGGCPPGCAPQCPPGCAPSGYNNYSGGAFIPPQGGCN